MTPTIGCPEAEAALIGCLLHLPAGRVVEIARRMVGEDLVDPRNRVLLAAAAVVASQGLDPDPALVLGQVRRLGAESSFTADRAAGTYLLDVYAAAGVPASVEAYLNVVLEHSYRRRLAEVGVRLEQVAGTAALRELQELVDEQVALLRQAAARMHQRHPAPAQAVA